MEVEADAEAAVAFLKGVFGPATDDPIFLCSLPNERGDPGQAGERRIATRSPEDIGAFTTRWDRAGRGLFFCVATLKEGAKPEKDGGSIRSKSNVSEMTLLHADVDAKSVTVTLDAVLAIVGELPCPPSIVVRSGHGLHLYWLLKEAVGQDQVAEIEGLNALLADLVGGDAVQDCCRLMRVPGSHNTKNGEALPVALEAADYDRRYELRDIEDMLVMMSPRVERRQAERKHGSPALVASNPFLAVAERFGFKPPIDVETRLREMSYRGAGESAVHTTQLQVTASLLNQGRPIEAVVDLVLAATQAAAGEAGSRWRWGREEAAIREMCVDWLRKHPLEVKAAVQGFEREDDVGAGRAKKPTTDRTRRPGANAIPVLVAEGVIESVREQGHDLLLTDGEVWIYGAGVWTVMTGGDEQWLRTLIQAGCDALGHSGDSKAANATWKRIVEHPDLYHRRVEWDGGDMIALAGCMMNLRTRETSPHASSHRCRKKIGFDFEPGAACPKWRGFLTTCFRDRPDEAPTFAALIQEWFGSALATGILAREQRKALFLFGGTRTGKTQVATVARRMIGEPVASPSIRDVSEQFGRQMLFGARAWIRDDAINEGDGLDPAIFKTIVTGEPVEVKIKNHAGATHSFDIPILLTTNAMPRARDASDAIYNRSLVVDMLNEMSEAEAETERQRLGFDGVKSTGEALAAEEGPGILLWALDGLDRLRERGRFDIPESVRNAVQRFKEGNNPTNEFVRTALERSEHGKVERHDLMAAFHAWSKEQFGDESKASGYRVVKERLEKLPWRLNFDVKVRGARYVGGLKLSDEGLTLWDVQRNGGGHRHGTATTSLHKADVNKHWARMADDDGGDDGTKF